MSRVSRRKTLSHSEIENFLSEINVEHKQSSSKETSQPLNALPSTTEIAAIDPMRTEVQSIRDFCKATFQIYRQGKPLEPTRELCDIGREILSGSSYPILSTRLLRPENYLYPSSSLEGKKSLLLSLSPMLSDAEEQRQKETSACENFTRCTSGKGKGKYSCYVYTDKDVKCQVDFPEYEKRYMLYIGQNKKTYAKATPMSPSLNYLTLQHRQRLRAERQSMSMSATLSMPKRNLQSILDGQMGEENRRVGNSPNQNVVKLFNKPKIEPVKLDDSTMELVNALMTKSRKATSNAFSAASVTVSAPAPTIIGGETTAGASANAAITSNNPAVTVGSTPAKRAEEAIRSPFAALCEFTSFTSTTISTSSTTTVVENPTSYTTTTNSTDIIESDVEELVPMEVDAYDHDAEDFSGSGFNDRKRKHNRGGRLLARRGTLSPASVRAMLLEVCDPDPQDDGHVLGDPFAMVTTVESVETASDESCSMSVSTSEEKVATPVKSPSMSPFAQAQGSPANAVLSTSANPVDAPLASPFSIRTALELRRSPLKSQQSSPSVPSNTTSLFSTARVGEASSHEVECARIEVFEEGKMDVSEQIVSPRHVEVEVNHAQDLVESYQEQQYQDECGQEAGQDGEEGQEQELKKARSGSPSAAVTRSFAHTPSSSPVLSPVPSPTAAAAAVSPVASPAVSCVSVHASPAVSPTHSAFVPSAVSSVLSPVSAPTSAEVRSPEHVTPTVASLVQSDVLNMSTHDDLLGSPVNNNSISSNSSEFSAAEMEVIDDFGRELDSLLCDTSVVSSSVMRSVDIQVQVADDSYGARTPVGTSKSGIKASNACVEASGGTSSWEGADEAFILSAPASPATLMSASSASSSLLSPIAAPIALCAASPEAVQTESVEVEAGEVANEPVEGESITFASPVLQGLEEVDVVAAGSAASPVAFSVQEVSTCVADPMVVDENEICELESAVEEDSGFSFIDQLIEAETVTAIPTIPTPTVTPMKDCTEGSMSVSVSVENARPLSLAVPIREAEQVASVPSPVPVVSLPRLTARVRTPVAASPSVALPMCVLRSSPAYAQASPLTSLHTPNGKAADPLVSSGVRKTPSSFTPSQLNCMPPTPPSVPRAPSAALSPKVAAYFSPFAAAATPASGMASGNRGDPSGRSLSARNSTVNTPASRGSYPLRSPYSCASSPANSAYSSRSSHHDADNSMDDSVLLFRYDEQSDEDLHTFEMLESMVHREYCEASAVTSEGDSEWSFGVQAESEEPPLTAHSTESSPASVRDTNDNYNEGEEACGLPVEGVRQPMSPSRSLSRASSDPLTTSTLVGGTTSVPAVMATPHPRTPQKKTPEQRSAGSSERKRRGLTFIPRYAVSPAAVVAASTPVATTAMGMDTSRSSGSHRVHQSLADVKEDGDGDSESHCEDLLEVSVCTALASADCEVSLADIAMPNTVPIETAASPIPSSVLGAVPPDESVYPEPFDLVAAQVAAKARYETRMQEARWRYEWELASAHMTHGVIQKHQNL